MPQTLSEMLSNSAGSEEAAADFDEFSTSKPSLEYLKAEKNFSLNFLSGQNNGPEEKETKRKSHDKESLGIEPNQSPKWDQTSSDNTESFSVLGGF